jgi:CBS-domain-containing membrane protein
MVSIPSVQVHIASHFIPEYSPSHNLVVKLSEIERHKLVDIGAAMNRGAYSVVQNTPLSKTYEIFTALGLRTLCVLGHNGSVVGIVTRSNLLPEYMESRTGLQMD